jgi:hypothetical protein
MDALCQLCAAQPSNPQEFGIPSVVSFVFITRTQLRTRRQIVKKFINEAPWDRIARIVLGIVMLYVGFGVMDGTWGIVVGVVGLIPLITGAIGWCPLYALFGTGTARDQKVTTSV